MSPLLFLSFLLLGTCYGQRTGRYQIGSTTKGAVNLVSGAANLGADAASQVVRDASATSKQVLDNVNSLGTNVITGGSRLLTQGLDMVDNIGGNIPVVRIPLVAATSVGRWLVNLLSNAGQQALKVGTTLGGNVADYTNEMTQLTTNSIKKFATDGSQLTSNTIDKTVSVMDELYNTIASNSQTGQGSTQSQGGNAQDPNAVQVPGGAGTTQNTDPSQNLAGQGVL